MTNAEILREIGEMMMGDYGLKNEYSVSIFEVADEIESPWISVEDALPEPDNGEEQNYLVEDESGYRHAESAWMLKHLLHHPWQPCSPPVAWMPIPERKV
jgi:hypothetical protein